MRTCTSLSSHSSVTSSSPWPLTSMPPPSSTIRCPCRRGAAPRARRPACRGNRPGDLRVERASCRTSPSALNPSRQQHDVAPSSWTPIGAESRSHTRSVGTTWSRTHRAGRRARRAPTRGVTRRSFVVAQDLDRLVTGDDARDLGVDPRNRAELARPVGLVMRPADPGRAMRLPLGRHAQPRRASSVTSRDTAEDRPVGVDAAVAQERPVAADVFDERRIAAGDRGSLRLRRLRR